MDIYRELQSEITAEISKIGQSTNAEKRIALIEIIRALDEIFTFASFVIEKNSTDDKSVNTRKLFDHYVIGWHICVCLFMDNSINRIGFPLFPSTEESMMWTHSCLMSAGNIGLCQRLLALQKTNVVQLHYESPDKIFAEIASQYRGLEYLETLDFDWWRDKKMNAPIPAAIDNLLPLVSRQLSDVVQPWKTHFIQYGSTPEIDDVYQYEGSQYIAGLCGFDYFDDNVTFGNIRFSAYKNILTCLIGLTLKHRDCSFALLKQSSQMHLRNLLSLPFRLDDLSASIADYLRYPCEIVNSVLETVTLNLNNVNRHSRVPGAAPAPLVSIGDGFVLRSITGILSNPLYFMIQELKARYPEDFFSAVNERERTFREELNGLFVNTVNIICSESAVTLKQSGKIMTDIDAMIFDKDSGTLVVIQLKSSDDFGTSMEQRYSRSKNFYETSVKWIDKVEGWLSSNDKNVLLNHFSPPLDERLRVKTVNLMIIGRNYAHFSDQLPDCDFSRAFPHLKG